MRCRSCGLRFDLLHTTFWGFAPGPPATPRQALVVFTVLLQIAASLFLVWPVTAFVFGLLSLVALLAWFLIYIDWLLFQGNPYDRRRAGTCPVCNKPNCIWPWSA